VISDHFNLAGTVHKSGL